MFKYQDILTNYDLTIDICKNKGALKLHIPRAWLITKNGTLYNTFGISNNGNANMEKPFEIIKKGIFEYSKEELLEVIDSCIAIDNYNLETIYVYNGVTTTLYNYYVGGIIIPNKFENNIPLSTNQNIITLMTGILEARIEFFKTFKEFILNNENYVELFNDLLNRTNNDILEILISFCGFSKIENTDYQRISTPQKEYEYLFREYINAGYKIDYVTSFTINNNRLEAVRDTSLTEDYHSLIKTFHGE